MGPGLPGFGIASLFYVVAGLLAPIREVVLTLSGRSSPDRWRMVGRQFMLSTVTVAAVIGFLLAIDRLVASGYLTVARGPAALAGIPNFGYALIAFVLVVGATNVVGFAYSRLTDAPAPAIVAASHRLGRTSASGSDLTNPYQAGPTAPDLIPAHVAGGTAYGLPLSVSSRTELSGVRQATGGDWPELTEHGWPQMSIDVMVWWPGLSEMGRAVMTVPIDEALAFIGKDFSLLIAQEGDPEPTRIDSVWLQARGDLTIDLPMYELRASMGGANEPENLFSLLIASSSPLLAELHEFLFYYWVGKGSSPTGPLEFDSALLGEEWLLNDWMSSAGSASVGQQRTYAMQ